MEEGALSQRRKEHSEEEGALRGRRSTQSEEADSRGRRYKKLSHGQEEMPPRTEQKGSVKENPRNFLRDAARLQRTRSFSMKHSVVLLG